MLLERRLQGIPEEGALATLRAAKQAAETAYKATQEELAVLDERLRRLKGQVEVATERLRRALERELAQFKEGDGERRKLERAQEATSVLEEFRSRVLRDNIARVEVAVLESFQHLVRKPGLVNSLSIDPESFEVQLVNDRGRLVKRDDLSAGEKQLLAISILWGLAKTAGIPMPVVVDTPLGRLDSKHRIKLIEHYFPQASHQVLLLSTDEEIRLQRLEDLEPFISRSYLLAYDDKQDRTTVEAGYFQHQA
jgi:DNA sulfur modification protein DndD